MKRAWIRVAEVALIVVIVATLIATLLPALLGRR